MYIICKRFLAQLVLSISLMLMISTNCFTQLPTDGYISGEFGVTNGLGRVIAMSRNGNIIITSLEISDTQPSKAIQAYLYKNGEWQKMGSAITSPLDLLDSNSSSFGAQLSLSNDGKVLVVSNPIQQGFTRVFTYNGTGWEQKGKVIAGENLEDRSGFSIDISGDGEVIAISSILNKAETNFFERGHVRVFAWDGQEWSQRGGDIDGTQNRAAFGYSVSLSEDGTRLVVGSPFYGPDGIGANSFGRIEIFDWTGQTWIRVGVPMDGKDFDGQLGRAVCIDDSGERIVAAAAFADIRDSTGYLIGRDEGKVYTYKLTTEGTFFPEENFIRGFKPGLSSGGSNYVESSLELSQTGEHLIIGSTGLNTVRVFVRSDNSWIQIYTEFKPNTPSRTFGTAVAISQHGEIFAFGNPDFTEQRNGILKFIGIINIYGESTVSTLTPKLPSLLVYPNPARKTLYLRGGDAEQWKIFDTSGRLLLSGGYQGTTAIEVSPLTNGIYILHLISENKKSVLVYRFVKS